MTEKNEPYSCTVVGMFASSPGPEIEEPLKHLNVIQLYGLLLSDQIFDVSHLDAEGLIGIP